MNRIIATSFITFFLCASASAQAQPADLSRVAGALPKLERTAGKLALPLDGKPPFVWRGVRKDVVVTSAGGRLQVGYRLAANQAAGAALVIAPQTLEGARSLRLTWHANRDLQVMVSLQDGVGVAYASPPIAVGTRDGTAEVDLTALSFLAAQSKTRDPGRYRVADTIMVTLVDISGFMSPEPHAVELSVAAIEVGFEAAR